MLPILENLFDHSFFILFFFLVKKIMEFANGVLFLVLILSIFIDNIGMRNGTLFDVSSFRILIRFSFLSFLF